MNAIVVRTWHAQGMSRTWPGHAQGMHRAGTGRVQRMHRDPQGQGQGPPGDAQHTQSHASPGPVPSSWLQGYGAPLPS